MKTSTYQCSEWLIELLNQLTKYVWKSLSLENADRLIAFEPEENNSQKMTDNRNQCLNKIEQPCRLIAIENAFVN